MKKPSFLFAVAAILLSDVMCAVVAYSYREMLCAIAHGGASAPASIALLGAIPFAVGIAICAAAAVHLRRHGR